ncbi:uncharacterized protein [Macrobrachium rosenbergii]|uniref:uncharacterized protein isoform X2 n=1 Tax=Macrobrachium rosenbergii TaxID=79674 RepID=UPI0034D56871
MSATLGQQTGTVFFSYSAPLYQVEQPNGSKQTFALYSVTLGVLFFLEHLFYENNGKSGKQARSIQQDQLELFLQIEDNISTLGFDGHSCVLRFICELQTNRFSRSSMLGELFTLMFTPKQGDNYTILKEYIEAEMSGQEVEEDLPHGARCSDKYSTCPVSVFAALRSIVHGGLGFSTPSDKPQNTTVSRPLEDRLSTVSSPQEDSPPAVTSPVEGSPVAVSSPLEDSLPAVSSPVEDSPPVGYGPQEDSLPARKDLDL